MNNKNISLELLKIYPEYKDKLTLLQFLSLFQETRRLVSDKNYIIEDIIYIDEKGNSFKEKSNIRLCLMKGNH